MVLYQTGKRIYIELTQNDVLLAQNLAKRCSVNIGESVFVSPVGQVFPMKMHVADIVANHEILIQDAVMNSYVYMDYDALFNALKITEENLDIFLFIIYFFHNRKKSTKTAYETIPYTTVHRLTHTNRI